MLVTKCATFTAAIFITFGSALLFSPVAVAVEDCKEGGPNECSQFVKPISLKTIRLVWCYKREKVANISNLCTFSDTQLTPLFTATAPPTLKKSCKPVTDSTHTCYKICKQLDNKVYPLLNVLNLCLTNATPYCCTSKQSEKEYCGCAQIANVDSTVKNPTQKPGDSCSG